MSFPGKYLTQVNVSSSLEPIHTQGPATKKGHLNIASFAIYLDASV
jgi:hypothetical protein